MPSLEDSLNYLRQLDQFRVVIESIRHQRDGAIEELGKAKDPYEVMKWSGVVRSLDDTLNDFAPPA